jgi:hypothetical protein
VDAEPPGEVDRPPHVRRLPVAPGGHGRAVRAVPPLHSPGPDVRDPAAARPDRDDHRRRAVMAIRGAARAEAEEPVATGLRGRSAGAAPAPLRPPCARPGAWTARHRGPAARPRGAGHRDRPHRHGRPLRDRLSRRSRRQPPAEPGVRIGGPGRAGRAARLGVPLLRPVGLPDRAAVRRGVRGRRPPPVASVLRAQPRAARLPRRLGAARVCPDPLRRPRVQPG